MNEEILAGGLVLVGVAGAIAALAAMSRRHAARRAARVALLERLRERFGDVPALVDVLRSPEGRAVAGVGDGAAQVAIRLLWTLVGGAVLAGLGGVLLWLGRDPGAGVDINLVRAAEDARWWGAVLSALGVAVLAAAAVAATIARRWRVIGDAH
jgi:hypothetical protein